MFNLIRMKKNEWKIKATFYSAIATLIENQKELLELIQKMYSALKDVPTDELREEFISKLAEIIHESEK